MAFLRRDPRGKSPFWYGCFRVPGKGQTQRSTGIKASERTRGEAMTIAVQWERQAKQLGPAVHLKNREAILEAFLDATQRAIAGDFTESVAREVLDTILKASGQGTICNESVREFATRWLNAREDDLADTSRIAYQAAVRMFLAHLGTVADKPINSVQTKHIEAFKAARIAEGISAKTVDRDLKVVRAVFRAGIEQGHLSFDPSRAVKLTSRQSKAQTQRVAREIFRPEEISAILTKAEGDWLTVTLVGRYTGARLGDCVRMRWNNVNLVSSVIRYTDLKTGKHYAVPIHPRLQSHLLTLANRGETQSFLSPTLAEAATGGCNGLSIQFQKIMKISGVDPMKVHTKSLREVEGKKPRTLATRSFHSLRHTYNTELANAEVPQEIRRKLVGHASNDMNDIYTHSDVEVFRGAINKLV